MCSSNASMALSGLGVGTPSLVGHLVAAVLCKIRLPRNFSLKTLARANICLCLEASFLTLLRSAPCCLAANG